MIRRDGSVTTLREAQDAHRKPVEDFGRASGAPKWVDPYKFGAYMMSVNPISPLARLLGAIFPVVLYGGVFIAMCIIDSFFIVIVISFVLLCVIVHYLDKWLHRIEKKYSYWEDDASDQWADELNQRLVSESAPFNGPSPKSAWDTDLPF
jgi:hypothetical protein